MKKLVSEAIDWKYIKVNEEQKKDFEYFKMLEFIKKYVLHLSMTHGEDVENIKISFISSTESELLFKLKLKDKEFLLHVNQPWVQYGTLKNEVKLLKNFKQQDEKILSSVDYYTDREYELFITPYIENPKRVINKNNHLGLFYVEKESIFQVFNSYVEKIVKICMLAKMVSLYDFERGEGIVETKFDDGDFILNLPNNDSYLTVSRALEHLYLTSVRAKKVDSFYGYLDSLKEELMGNEKLNYSVQEFYYGVLLGKAIIQSTKNVDVSCKFSPESVAKVIELLK